MPLKSKLAHPSSLDRNQLALVRKDNVAQLDLRTNRLRILHIGKFYPPHSGGIETHLHDLAVRQARTASVSVVVSNKSVRTELSELDGVRVTRVGKVATIASMPLCPSLPRVIRRSPADLVHIHVPNPGAAFAFLQSGHTGQIVMTHHADTLGRRNLRRLSDPFVVRLMKRAKRIIVTSSSYLNSSEELRPFRDKCRIIPLGIDLEHIAAPDPRKVSELRARFGKNTILAVGRLVPYKGFDVLVRAMKHVDGKLLLVGAGPLAASLAKLAEAENVQHKIEMLGWIEDLAPYFENASMFVLSSVTRAEAFGLVQLEAMAAGLPIVNTSIDSAVPEVSPGGKTGITVPPGDATRLGEAIQLLLDRPDLRQKFGNAAKARVHAEFTADLMESRTMSLYEEILA